MKDYMKEITELEEAPLIEEIEVDNKFYINLSNEVKDYVNIGSMMFEDSDIIMTHKDDLRVQFVKNKNHVIAGTPLTIRNYLKSEFVGFTNHKDNNRFKLVAYERLIPKEIFNCIISYVNYKGLTCPFKDKLYRNNEKIKFNEFYKDYVDKYDYQVKTRHKVDDDYYCLLDIGYSFNIFNTLDVIREMLSLRENDPFRVKYIGESDEYYVINGVYITKPHEYKVYKEIESFPFIDDIEDNNGVRRKRKYKSGDLEFIHSKEVGLFDTGEIDITKIKNLTIDTFQVFTVVSHINGNNYVFKVIYLEDIQFNELLSQFSNVLEPVNFKVNLLREVRSSVMLKDTNIIITTENKIKGNKSAFKNLYINTDRFDENNNFIVNYSFFTNVDPRKCDMFKRPINLFYFKYNIECSRECFLEDKYRNVYKDIEPLGNFKYNLINCITQYPPSSIYSYGKRYHISNECKYETKQENKSTLDSSQFI